MHKEKEIIITVTTIAIILIKIKDQLLQQYQDKDS